MNPDTILKIISSALASGDLGTEAKDLAEDLRRWISCGGHAPRWPTYPKASHFYTNHVTQYYRDLTRSD